MFVVVDQAKKVPEKAHEPVVFDELEGEYS